MILLLEWVWANWVLGLAKLPLTQADQCAPSLVLQMSNTSGWDQYLGNADMNSVCQDYRLVVASLASFLCHSHIPIG